MRQHTKTQHITSQRNLAHRFETTGKGLSSQKNTKQQRAKIAKLKKITATQKGKSEIEQQKDSLKKAKRTCCRKCADNVGNKK